MKSKISLLIASFLLIGCISINHRPVVKQEEKERTVLNAEDKVKVNIGGEEIEAELHKHGDEYDIEFEVEGKPIEISIDKAKFDAIKNGETLTIELKVK